MTLNPRPGPGAAGLFDRLAARYDAWYDGPAGAAVFPSEAHCLRPLFIGLPRPWTEIGTSSGRFAAALGMDVGLDDGAVILGMVFADSPWGRFYQHKAVGEYPFYAAARFLTRAAALALVIDAGLRVQAARSALHQPPSDTPAPEPARDGEDPAASFTCWRAVPSACASEAEPD